MRWWLVLELSIGGCRLALIFAVRVTCVGGMRIKSVG